MPLTISGQNNVVYRNGTTEIHRVTIECSGAARIQVKPQSGLQVFHQEQIAEHGGAASLEAAPSQRIEIDVLAAQTQIQVSFVGVK